MKKYRVMLLFLLFVPVVVFARTDVSNSFPLFGAIGLEAFVTIHMSFFVLKPLANLINEEKSKGVFWAMFFFRIFFLLTLDLMGFTEIAFFDFIFVFIGAFLLVPLLSILRKKNPYMNKVMREKMEAYATVSHMNLNTPNSVSSNNASNTQIVLTCKKCGNVLQVNDHFCSNCGEAFDGDNVVVGVEENVFVKPSDFDSMYSFSEDKLLEEFIRKEMITVGLEEKSSLLPSAILKRRKIFRIIFCIYVFVFISSIFFHFPILTYIIGFILFFLIYYFSKNYNLMKYLKKEVKSRPSEQISNILMQVKSSLVMDNSKKFFCTLLVVAIIFPLILFFQPRIMYEKVDGGYRMRFYTFGLTNFTSVEIPDSYKGEAVVGLRGNAFSNMFFLKSVKLPDSITEIRGQAFKNDFLLKEVHLPTQLTYLGGGSFYNCWSITEMEIPDSVEFMGGEIFYNAKALQTVKLSENISEIRGNSFENCTSLKKITVPDKVERIGGHAFYGNSSLTEVSISENSSLNEIGSSAFRQCYLLKQILLPDATVVNIRAFKESPTIVKRYGKVENTQVNEKDYSSFGEANYKQTGLLFFPSIGSVKNISSLSQSYSHSVSITLVDAQFINGYYQFILKYTDDLGETLFVLDKDTVYKEINGHFAFAIYSSRYLTNFTGGLQMYVYFN